MTRGRRLLLVMLSFGVLALAIVIYSHFSGDGWQEEPSDIQPVNGLPVSTEHIKRVGPGQGIMEGGQGLHVVTRGPGGKIQREYHIERFELETEDLASMEEVRLIWHLDKGQTLTLTSATGEAHIERGSGNVQLTDGWLRGKVRIMLRRNPVRDAEELEQDSRGPQDVLVTTDNMKFDARSCMLQTEEAVDLWGPDVEVHGTGMLLRWREVTRQIDKLVIKHGQELIWRGAVASDLKPKPEQTRTTVKPEKQAADGKEGEKIHSYLASFQGKARVTFRTYKDQETYQEQVLESADHLNILFDLAAGDQLSKEKRSPGGKGPREPRAARHWLRLTWDDELIVVPAEPAPDAAQGEKSFGIEAVGQPVKFKSADFSGSCPKLQAEHDTRTVRLLSNEAHRVHLESSTGDTIDCDRGDFNWNSGLGKFIGRGTLRTARPHKLGQSSEKDIELTWQERASVLFVERPSGDDSAEAGGTAKDFYLKDALAVGDVHVTSDQMSATAGRLHVKLGPPGSDGTDDGQAIEGLQAWDGFSSKLPHKDEELGVSARSMNATFSPSKSGQGQFVSQIELTEQVQAVLPSSKELGQDKLTCDHLRVEMDEAEDEEETALADGSEANDYGNLVVSRLVASGNVIGRHEIQGQAPSGFTADRMERRELPGQLERTFWPQEGPTPAYDKLTVLSGEKAMIRKGQDSLSSKVIVIIETEGDDTERLLTLSTPGAGDMKASFEPEEKGEPPALLDLYWPGWMMFDRKADTAVFTGLVRSRVRGTVEHSTTRSSGLRTEKLELFFKPEPVSELDKALASSRELISTEPFFEPVAQRKLDRMVLIGSSEVSSIEHPSGDPKTRQRSALLKSEKLTYQTQTESFRAEGPGNLLLEDYRKTETEVSGDQAEPISANAPSAEPLEPSATRVRKGQTAFRWDTSANYDQNERQAVLNGNVYMNAMGYGIALPSRGQGQDRNTRQQLKQTRLWCGNLAVTFGQDQAGDTAEQEAGTSIADLSAMDELAVREVRTTKEVTLKSGDAEINADEMVYNPTRPQGQTPAKYDLEIKGNRKSRAEMIYIDPEQGWTRLRGRIIRYNTLTQESEVVGGTSEHFGPNKP